MEQSKLFVKSSDKMCGRPKLSKSIRPASLDLYYAQKMVSIRTGSKRRKKKMVPVDVGDKMDTTAKWLEVGD